MNNQAAPAPDSAEGIAAAKAAAEAAQLAAEAAKKQREAEASFKQALAAWETDCAAMRAAERERLTAALQRRREARTGERAAAEARLKKLHVRNAELMQELKTVLSQSQSAAPPEVRPGCPGVPFPANWRSFRDRTSCAVRGRGCCRRRRAGRGMAGPVSAWGWERSGAQPAAVAGSRRRTLASWAAAGAGGSTAAGGASGGDGATNRWPGPGGSILTK